MNTKSKERRLVIIGGGEHASVVIDAAKLQGWELFGFVDCQDNLSLSVDCKVPYLGSDEEIVKLASNDSLSFIVGIGSNSLREKIVKSYKLKKSQWATIIHPSAIISTMAKIEEGSVILAKSIVQPNAKVGRHAIINSNTLVEHDSQIGNFSHLAPGTILGGGVLVGNNCLIGIGAKVRDHIRISDNCIVGTGAVVVSDIKPNKTVVGIPAMPIHESSEKYQISDLCVSHTTSLHDAMEVMARTGQMVALVVDEQKLIGLLTDGDVRKALLANSGMDEPVGLFMCDDFISVHESISSSSALEIMKANGIRHLPVTDDSGKLIDLHSLSGVAFGESPDLDVVIMAGGKGTRLLPLTEKLPKPMVRVAGKPILEHIILHLICCQVREFHFAVNHLSEKITEYFQDGANYGCKINYLLEDKPLGTGGALKLLKQTDPKTVLAMNGDLITQVNIEKMLKVHETSGNLLTVGVRDYKISIPYGVIQTLDQDIKAIVEKPDKHFLINAGIYLINPELIAQIPENEVYPITNLINHCLVNDLKTGIYLVEGDWVDIGQHHDLNKARGF